MRKTRKHIAPWVKKIPLTIIAVGDTGTEPEALRKILEYLGYRVDVVWVGSRREFIEVLRGTIKTAPYLVLSVHGIEEGVAMPDEKAVTPTEIAKIGKLSGKTVLNLGCDTGRGHYVDAFVKEAGAKAYIAPIDYVDGNSSLFFALNLFYEIKNGKSLHASAKKARKFDKQTQKFKLFKR